MIPWASRAGEAGGGGDSQASVWAWERWTPCLASCILHIIFHEFVPSFILYTCERSYLPCMYAPVLCRSRLWIPVRSLLHSGTNDSEITVNLLARRWTREHAIFLNSDNHLIHQSDRLFNRSIQDTHYISSTTPHPPHRPWLSSKHWPISPPKHTPIP
jgi:hypothetical protein